MKRIINVRGPVLIAFSLALGVLLGYYLNYYDKSIVWLIAVVPFAAIIFLLCVIFKKEKLLVISVLISVLFTGGVLSCYYVLQNYRVCEADTQSVCLICGKVKEKGFTEYGEYITIGNVTVNSDKISGKVRVYLSETYGDYCDVGYTVEFYTKLKFNDTFPYGELNYYAEDNVKYTCSNYSELASTYHFSLTGSINSLIKNTLYDNLDYDTASICHGMLLGNTQNISQQTLNTFRYGGIAHIFAVSGLHIGLIYGVLSFLLKKLRVNKYVSAVIRIISILCYAGICGFSVSSVRAVIMCGILILTRLFHVKSDGLNNLGFATIIILLISPLSLFSVGFQLSVCGMAGIYLLSVTIRNKLNKIKIPNKISSTFGVSLGAQAGTLPVMLAKFGYISGTGLILNLIIIPIVSVLFTVLFAGTLISLIIPPAASIVMQYSALPLECLLSFLVSANFEKALISGFGSGLFVPIYFIVLFILSDKINLKAVSRSVLFTCGIAVMVICVLMNTHLPAIGYKLTVSSYNYGGSVLIKSTQGNVLVMTEEASITRMKQCLNRQYVSSLDGVILVGGDYCAEYYDMSLNCKDVYLCSLTIPVQPFQTIYFHYVKDFSICGIDFEYIDGHNLIAMVDGAKIIISDDKIGPAEDCNLFITLHENAVEDVEVSSCIADYTIYFNIGNTEYNAYDNGDFSILIKDGIIDI